MRKILAALLLIPCTSFAGLLDDDEITTVYDPYGLTVLYPAGKENEWSVSRINYGHTSLDEVNRAGSVSRDTTDALLNGGSVLDALK